MLVTLFGVVAVTFMMSMYALERRHPRYVALFALGCLLSSAYGFLAGAWPFGCVELIWAGVALRRYRTERRSTPSTPTTAVAAQRPAPTVRA
jgi:hypothetical protein